ncbi:MAG: ribbon-helix-helix domain-containing protein [Candidatus Brocadiales bacterium]
MSFVGKEEVLVVRVKKPLTVYLDPDVIKQLKLIGIEHDMSNQDMLSEALNDYFVKYSKAQITCGHACMTACKHFYISEKGGYKKWLGYCL